MVGRGCADGQRPFDLEVQGCQRPIGGLGGDHQVIQWPAGRRLLHPRPPTTTPIRQAGRRFLGHKRHQIDSHTGILEGEACSAGQFRVSRGYRQRSNLISPTGGRAARSKPKIGVPGLHCQICSHYVPRSPRLSAPEPLYACQFGEKGLYLQANLCPLRARFCILNITVVILQVRFVPPGDTKWSFSITLPLKTMGTRAAQLITELNERRRSTFTLADVESITGLPQATARSLVSKVRRRGLVTRLKPGLYSLVPFELGRATRACRRSLPVGRRLSSAIRPTTFRTHPRWNCIAMVTPADVHDLRFVRPSHTAADCGWLRLSLHPHPATADIRPDQDLDHQREGRHGKRHRPHHHRRAAAASLCRRRQRRRKRSLDKTRQSFGRDADPIRPTPERRRRQLGAWAICWSFMNSRTPPHSIRYGAP